MIAPFALDLGHDGIRLLQRTAYGWHELGQVALDDADFAERLVTLREQAEAVSETPFCTELIIPGSQILYTTVDVTGSRARLGDEDIRAALDGRTPVPIDELVFDWRRSEGKIRAAVLEQKTLDEAEDFATAHGFNPVAFTARPDPGDFPEIPEFGPTHAAALALAAGSEVTEPESEPTEPGIVDAAKVEPSLVEPEQEEPEATEPEIEAPETGDVFPETADPTPQDAAETDKDDTAEDEAGEDHEPEIAFASRRAGSRHMVPDVPVTAAPAVPRPAPPVPTPPRPAPPTAPAPGRAPVVASRPKAPRATRRPGTLRPEEATEARALAAALARVSSPAGETVPAILPASAEGPRRTGALMVAALAFLFSAGIVWIGYVALQGRPDTPEVATVPSPAPEARLEADPPRSVNEVVRADPDPVIPAPSAPALATPEPVEQAVVIPAPEVPPLVQPETPDTNAPDRAAPAAALPVPVAPRSTEAPTGAAPALPGLTAPIPEALAEFDDAAPEPAEDADTLAALPEGALTEDQALTRYAVTGIWELAPRQPALPSTDTLDTLYLASIDPGVEASDAVSLAAPVLPGATIAAPAPPPGPDDVFDVDERGFVRATPDGALTPDGVIVRQGEPPLVPPTRPAGAAVQPDTAAAVAEALAALPPARPRTRPENLLELRERSLLGGRTLEELATIRPTRRPDSEQILAARAAGAEPTELAIEVSRAPLTRPDGFETIVAAAVAARAPATPTPAPETGQTAPTPVVAAPQTPQPQIPTVASVARQATIEDAINLRRLNLIGTYGQPNDRRALLRLPSGRYVKVQVGDNVDGGQVAAIGESDLRYVKGGRSIVLEVPDGG